MREFVDKFRAARAGDFGAFDWEISPCEYQSNAAAPRISFTNSVGDKRSAESAPSGRSNVIFGIVLRFSKFRIPRRELRGNCRGAVRSNGAPRRPVSFYRLSADLLVETGEASVAHRRSRLTR